MAMTTITRGIIKAYDAGSHRASVQLAGSLAVWLDSLPVSDALEPPELVAGRECGVLFFSEDDPEDACVVSVHNAVPVGTNRLRDADADTSVYVEYAPDEDKIRLTALGTLRVLVQSASPHLDVTGDQRVSGHLAAGDGVLPNAAWILGLRELSASGAGMDGVNNTVYWGAGQGGSGTRGVTGEVLVQSANALTWTYVRGLEFRATHSGSGTVAELVGANVQVNGTGPTGTRDVVSATMLALDNTATRRAGVRANLTPSIAATYTDYKAFYSQSLIARSTITSLYHYTYDDASVVLGGAVTTVYGYHNPGMLVGTNRRPFWDGGIAGSTSDASGNRFRSNTAFGTVAAVGLFGGGDGVIHLHNAAAAPAGNPTAGTILYVDGATGQLKARGAAGTVTVLAPP